MLFARHTFTMLAFIFLLLQPKKTHAFLAAQPLRHPKPYSPVATWYGDGIEDLSFTDQAIMLGSDGTASLVKQKPFLSRYTTNKKHATALVNDIAPLSALIANDYQQNQHINLNDISSTATKLLTESFQETRSILTDQLQRSTKDITAATTLLANSFQETRSLLASQMEQTAQDINTATSLLTGSFQETKNILEKTVEEVTSTTTTVVAEAYQETQGFLARRLEHTAEDITSKATTFLVGTKSAVAQPLSVPGISPDVVARQLERTIGDITSRATTTLVGTKSVLARRLNVPDITLSPTMETFIRRLDTVEDKLRIHKITSVIWTLAGFGISGVGLSNGFTDIPAYLESASWGFFASSTFVAASSIRMAFQFRANDPIVKKGFINMSVSMVSLAYIALYLSPFAPEWCNDFVLGNGFFELLNLPTLLMSGAEALNYSKSIKHRGLRNKEGHSVGQTPLAREVADFLSYGLTVFGAVGLSAAGVLFAANPDHSRQAVMDMAANGGFSSAHYLAESFYASVLMSFSAGVGALAITLRDRKLINKEQEQILVALFFVPGFLLNLKALGTFDFLGASLSSLAP